MHHFFCLGKHENFTVDTGVKVFAKTMGRLFQQFKVGESYIP